jgi:hypothetical protein
MHVAEKRTDFIEEVRSVDPFLCLKICIKLSLGNSAILDGYREIAQGGLCDDLVTFILCSGFLMASFLRLKHAASGGDIDAAALAEGAGESCVAEDFLKLHAGGAGGAGESAGGIERDEIDVGVDAFE